MTACVTGILFILTLFFSPLFLMIPSIATAPALVMVGIFMIEPLRKMELNDISIALPVFLTVALMPFTYNIAYGILFGLIGYTVGQIAAGKTKQITKTVWVLTAEMCIRDRHLTVPVFRKWKALLKQVRYQP